MDHGRNPLTNPLHKAPKALLSFTARLPSHASCFVLLCASLLPHWQGKHCSSGMFSTTRNLSRIIRQSPEFTCLDVNHVSMKMTRTPLVPPQVDSQSFVPAFCSALCSLRVCVVEQEPCFKTPVRAGNSGPHGGHAAPWGGREIHAGTLTSCSSAFATPTLCAYT